MLLFCNSDEGANRSLFAGALGRAERLEITPALLHAHLLSINVPSTINVANALISEFSGGKCVLLPPDFERLAVERRGAALGGSSSAGRIMVPKKLAQKRSTRLLMPAHSEEGGAAAAVAAAEAGLARDALTRHRFNLQPDQVIVQVRAAQRPRTAPPVL
eukprot:SAG11_NODE_1676_length_4475_cov_6.069698_3_plen_160_part_00